MLDAERERITPTCATGVATTSRSITSSTWPTPRSARAASHCAWSSSSTWRATTHGAPPSWRTTASIADRINVFTDYDPTAARTDRSYARRLDTLRYRGLNLIYEGKPNLRPRILRRAVPLYPNYVYNASQVDKTYADLMALGYFRGDARGFSPSRRGATTRPTA